MLRASFVLLIFLLPLQAHALTGNELLKQLHSKDIDERMQGQAYILGAIEMESLHLALIALQTPNFEEFRKKRVRFICVPDGATHGQLNDVVKRRLELVADDRHNNAAVLVRFAAYAAWPCPH